MLIVGRDSELGGVYVSQRWRRGGHAHMSTVILVIARGGRCRSETLLHRSIIATGGERSQIVDIVGTTAAQAAVAKRNQPLVAHATAIRKAQ